MGILADWQIQNEVRIEPFHTGPCPKGTLSYGTSGYGYDVRLDRKFKIFTNVFGAVVDPKAFDPKAFVEHEGDTCVIPPNSFILGSTIERISVPRDILVICVGKSTYARCFTADTRVKLADGTSPTLKEMADAWNAGQTEFYGFGVTDDRSYVVQRLILPRKVGTERIWEVTLDSGESVRCTSDHKFCLRTGCYSAADSLRPGDSLMPLYTQVTDGYTRVWNPFTRKYRQVSHLTDDMLVRAGVLPPRDSHEDVHHEDGNRTNNYPSNLRRMNESDHARHHNSTRDMGAQSRRYWSDPDKKAAHLAVLHSAEANRKAGLSRSAFYSTPEGQAVLRESARKSWETRGEEGRTKQADVARNLRLRDDVTEDAVRNALLEAGTIRGAARLLSVDRTAFKRFPNLIREFKDGALLNNHRVVSVRDTGLTQDVYCLTAPFTGNFALDAGVIVHNCGLLVNVTPLEPEWVGHVTIEISNTTPLPVTVYANEGIAQMLFLRADRYDSGCSSVNGGPLQPGRLGTCSVSYADKGGKYQGQAAEVTLPRVST